MSTVLYHATMSLDSFIARPGDDMSGCSGQVTGCRIPPSSGCCRASGRC
ncbi:hypothetical protein [Amycolatopsis sp. FDAARGOS 1241]|nr:hypothetical protein [Amycolatopsis sp. FDAARGOS 1241]